MRQLEIGPNEAGQRLDKYLKKLLPKAETNFLYKMLRKKNIVCNGKKADGSLHLAVGDQITLYLSDETLEKFSPDKTFRPIPQNRKGHGGKVELQILYEDEDILLINKPAGLLSQKSVPSDVSANELIIQYLLDAGAVSQQTLKTFRPSVCNRLDRNTSGILIAGKTLHGLQVMARQLKARSIQKYYRCVVVGTLTKGQHLKACICKDTKENKVKVCGLPKEDKAEVCGPPKEKGKNARYIETEYRPLGHGDGCTMLEVHLITGRSHQIRAHLACIGHPILGDPKYGDPDANRRFYAKTGIRHQLLHAYRAVLADGREVVAPLPEVFSNFNFRLDAEPALPDTGSHK